MTAQPRVAIYARHSTSLQNPESSEDQIRACGPLVDRLNGRIVETHSDPEVSGYRRDRRGLKDLLNQVRAGEVDIVVCEALDRLARDGEDVAWLGKQLRYHRVQLYTTTEGEICEVKLAVASMMGAIFLENLRKKTLRDMEAAVLAGRIAGGRVYGYRRAEKFEGNGERIRGLLEIDPQTAPVVVRILAEFASGKSAYAIATILNSEGVPGPSGGKWNQSTIRGDPKKHVGILHNPLYRGRLVWGRREWRRDPDSEKRERRYRLRDRSQWIETQVPELRIVDTDLARRVQAEVERRTCPRRSGNSAGQMRKKHLLSGLIKCGICGRNYVINGKDYYRCAGQREGTCDGDGSIRKSVVEEAALQVIQDRLMTTELAELFALEFAREIERLQSGSDSEAARLADRLKDLDAEITNLANNFAKGAVSDTLIRMLNERETEKNHIEQRLQAAASARKAIVLPHPVLIERYGQQVRKAREALSDPCVREEASQTLTSLIDTITIHMEGSRAFADIVGNPAGIIDLAYDKPATSGRKPVSSIAVVAGVGFEPTTFRL